MILKEQSHKVWGLCPTGKEESILLMERCGRVCYNSEAKIGPGTARPFVDDKIKKGHLTCLEPSNFVLVSRELSRNPVGYKNFYQNMLDSKYLTFVVEHGRVYIGGNVRAWLEAIPELTLDQLYDETALEGFTQVTDNKEIPWELRRVVVFAYTDRAVTHEWVRHRPCSYLQQSQRYVANDGNMEFIKPSWYDGGVDCIDINCRKIFLDSCKEVEYRYQELRKYKLMPQHARVVLSNQVATKIIAVADLPEWDIIFGLRTVKSVYPQTRKLMTDIQSDFCKEEWWSK